MRASGNIDLLSFNDRASVNIGSILIYSEISERVCELSEEVERIYQ